MRLDIRVPLGLMFFLIGSILALYGLFGSSTVRAHAAGTAVNLWCGLVLMLFGFACLALAWRGCRKDC